MQNILTRRITSKRTIKTVLIAVGIGIGFIVFGGVMLLSLYIGDKYIYDVFYKEIFQEPVWYLFLSLTFIITSLLGIWLVFKVKKLKDNNKSFTLIELLVVIAIIGVIAAIIVVNMSGATDKAKIAKGQAFSAKIGIELADSVVSKWNFDEGTGVTAKDPWEENNGTLTNFDFNDNSGWRSGGECAIGSCLEFDGINDYVDLPNNLGYTSQVSVFAWFKSKGVPAGGYHIIFGGQELEISIPSSTGEIRAGVYTTSRYVSNHGSGLIDGNWHYIGFTFDGSIKKSYIDGNFVGEQINITGSLTYSFANRRMGRFGSSATYYANGLIDEAQIYNSAATISQIQSQYLAGLQELLSKGSISQKEYNQRVKKIVLE